MGNVVYNSTLYDTTERPLPLAEGRRAPGTIRQRRDLPRDRPPSSSPPAEGPESSSPDLEHKQEEVVAGHLGLWLGM